MKTHNGRFFFVAVLGVLSLCLPGISATLSWNTFLGGTSDDYGSSIVLDTGGNVYVAGTSGVTWGTPVHPFAGGTNAYAAKLNGSGVLQWHTFLGASTMGLPDPAIAVDASGNVYVSYDTFVVKLNNSGALQWSAFLGAGTGNSCNGVAVDASGNIYAAGSCNVTWGTPVNPFSGRSYVAKLDGNGVVQWNTFLGGAGSDPVEAITFDTSGNIYLAGTSTATWGAPVRPFTYGDDAFVAKLNGSGTLQWNTFLGSYSTDHGSALAVDASGNVYVTGYSGATWESPVRPFTAGGSDAFVVKLNGSGALQWNAFLGSFHDDSGFGIAVDTNGYVYVAGVSDATWGTPDPPYIPGPYTYRNPNIFVAKLNSGGAPLLWNGFFGGTIQNLGYAMVMDLSRNVYVAGRSQSTWGSPVRPFAGGTYDAFVAKISPNEPTPTLTVTSPNGGESWIGGSAHNISWTTTGTVANVKLEYSANNGTNWTTIVDSTANTNSYAWTVPVVVSTNCLIRVSDASNAVVSDMSDAVFSIIATPTLAVTSPNGGESWQIGSVQNITWTTTSMVANVKLEYSTNNGTNWTTIIASTPNNGSYAWTIPNTPSTSCQICISDVAIPTTSDYSNATFTINTAAVTQRQALIDLYNATNGDSWTDNSGWKTQPLDADGFAMPGTETSWYGVTTDTGVTTVQQLNLASNNLVGYIPVSLGNLSGLQILNLKSNQLSGSIPAALGNLVNLTELSLQANQLTGTLPVELANMSQLTDMVLYTNQLTGGIPTQFGSFPNLKILMLAGNQLTGSIPIELGNLIHLTYLDLGPNQLSGTIPPVLGNLVDLTDLWLNNNQLTGGIPTELGNLVNLTLLALDFNQLTGSIPTSLGNLVNLQYLKLSSNELSGAIPTELGSLTNLTELKLGDNQLTGGIPTVLCGLNNLTYLGLYMNQLTGTIPPGLGNLTNLTYLGLQANQLTGGIPMELGNLSNLIYLTLRSNQLTGTIPLELGSLSNLQWLYLHTNQLSGEIPPQLGNLVNLTDLDLHSNKLTGSIPTSLSSLTNLTSTTTNLGYNTLYSTNAGLTTFLDSKDADWAATQTIAPTSVAAAPGDGSAEVTWTPIAYTGDTGGYRVFYATTLGGPYTFYAQTADKTGTSQVVSGLTNGIPYYFVVQTRTDVHENNQNIVDSGNSLEATATPVFVPTGTLTVTSPNGGENWLLRSTHPVTWTSTGTIGNVKIEYSTDNGTSWTTIVASTANDGVFSWTSGSPTDAALNTLSTTCLVRVSDAAGAAVPDISNAVFTISASGIITGTVTDLSGAPIEGASAQAFDLNNIRVATRYTNASGQYWIAGLPAGSYKIVFFNDYTQNYLYEWYNDQRNFNAAASVAVTLNNTTANINAQLGVGGIISGRVTNESGAGLEGVSITAFTENGYFGLWSAESDSNGDYQVKGLPAGNCRLMYYGLSGYPLKFYGNVYTFDPATNVPVTLGAETSGINIVLENGGQISGTVTDGSGSPVSGIRVLFYDPTNHSNLRFQETVVTAANGTYSGLVRTGQTKVYFDTSSKPASGLRSQFYSNQSSLDSAGAVSVVKNQTTPNINAVLAAGGGTLTVQVTNGLGQGVVAAAYLYDTLYGIRTRPSSSTDANGYLEIKGLIPGNYKVNICDANGEYGRYVKEWYNNALTFENATPVNVTEGGTTALTVVLGETAPVAPEINLKQGATNIATGGTYGFGTKIVGTDTDTVFTIQNTGSAALTLSGLPLMVGGTNANQFSITVQPTSPVAAAGSKTFTVRFHPTSAGDKTAQLSIANNDGNENPYVLNLTGTGTVVGGIPAIGLSNTALNFGAERSGTPTAPQDCVVSNTGTGVLNWTASSSATWLGVTPGSGTGAGLIFVSILNTNLAAGTYTGTITVADPNATNSPRTITVTLIIKQTGTDSPPFGKFETPTDGATVASSVPVTGWVLDDVGMKSIKIYRGTGLADRVFIGDAIMVEGARPDVRVAYPTYPENSIAGWGYMLLTNFLPNGGNGTFTLLAYAKDTGGHEVLLGTKTITCDNTAAVKPFGAIDTPTQGGTASGSNYVNFGWALTPQPNSIPTNGSTIWVYVDGVPLGHPTYNNYRKDIATLFPGYVNSNGAVGYYYLNTALYADAVHTIVWSVADSGGNMDGIGSRYFSIQNAGGGSEADGTEAWGSGVSNSNTRFNVSVRSLSEIATIPEDGRTPVYVKRGYRDDQQAEIVFPEADGSIRITIPEVSRVALYLNEENAGEKVEETAERGRRILKKSASTDARYEVYQFVGSELLPLPIGASFDSRDGVFYWQPGPGFLGEFSFILVDSETMTRRMIKITIVSNGESSK